MRRPFVLTLLVTRCRSRSAFHAGSGARRTAQGRDGACRFHRGNRRQGRLRKTQEPRFLGHSRIAGANITGKIPDLSGCPQHGLRRARPGPAARVSRGPTVRTPGKYPLTGERLLEGEEKEDMIREATFNEELHSKELYDKIECRRGRGGRRQARLQGCLHPQKRQAHDRILRQGEPPPGQVESRRRRAPRAKSRSRASVATTSALTASSCPSRHREGPGAEMTVKFTEIKHDVDIPADTFKRPASLDRCRKEEGRLMRRSQ